MCIKYFLFQIMGKFNYGKLLKRLQTRKDQIAFLHELGLIPKSRKCENCEKVLDVIYSQKDYNFFRCFACDKKFSVRADTILSNSKISLRKFVLLIYLFIANYWTYKQIQVYFLKFKFISLATVNHDICFHLVFFTLMHPVTTFIANYLWNTVS